MARLGAFTGFLALGVIVAVPAAGAPPAYKLKELQPGAGSSYPTLFTEFQGVADPAPRTYFHASYASPGPGLWKTDGTDAGTVLVTTSKTISNMYETAVVGGKLFFASSGLWVSDGTDAGTVQIPNSGGNLRDLFDAGGGRLVYAADPGSGGWVLYVSDGTTATAYPAYYSPNHFTAFGSRVLFTDYNSQMILFDPAAGTGVVLDSNVHGIAVHGGLIYYNKETGYTGYEQGELWRSGGTPGDGVQLSNLWPGGDAAPGSFASLGANLFFTACTPDIGRALYKWDGNAISLVADPVPGNSCDNLQDLEGPDQLIVRLGRLFFVADDGVHGMEIWSSDGTPGGTALVKDIRPGIASPGPYGALLKDTFCEDSACTAEWGGVFYFSANDGVNGEALWKTDGTEVGTVLVQDFSTRRTYSSVGHLRIAGSRLFLAAGDAFPNVEPWVLPLTPTVFAPPVKVAEGTGGTPTAAVTVSLEPPATSTVTVSWSTADDTAVAGSDYTAVSGGTLTFAPGAPPQTILVPLVGDSDVEPDERLFVDLSSTGAPVGTSRVAVTLRNDDGPAMSVSDITVPESGTQAFTVTLSAPSAQNVTVHWAIEEETATPSVNGPDYSVSPTSGDLTFAPSEVSKTIPFTVTSDTRDEEDETLFLRLTNAVGADMPIDFVRATITDDDGPPSVSVSANASANEGGATSHNKVTFSVPLTGLTGKPVQVCYKTSDGTAVAGIDYVAQHGCLTPNNDSVTPTVEVPIIGDNVDEAAETFFFTLLDPPVNATIGTAQRQGTINNDDAARLSVGNVTVVEGAAGTTTVANFTVTLSTPSSFTVTVDYATAPGTTNPATAGVDYASASGTLTFQPGTTSQTAPVTVIGDDLDEGASETFFLDLTNPTNATIQTARGTGTITDDDVARFSVADVSVVEGNSGTTNVTLTVTMGATLSTDASVKYYTQDGTAKVADGDFVGISNGVPATAVVLPFPAGTLSQQVTVQVNGDAVREVSNEYFYLKLTGATGTTIADGQATVTILDDDLQTADRRLSIAPKTASVTEPISGETSTSFTVLLFTATGTTPTPSGLPVTVSIVAGGTATPSADYTGVPATLTFAPGTSTQTVTAAVQADTILENPETAVLTLANPTNATIAATSTTTSGSATLYIYDSVSQETLDFYTVQPCRAVDTRDPTKGGPTPVAAGSPRTFPIGGVCGVPLTARAVSMNVTVTRPSTAGNVRVYPGGTALPSTSNLNFVAGQTRPNNAIVLLGTAADVTIAVAPTGTAHVIVDVNGYME